MPNHLDLTGKVAIVTGASRGIGAAIAESLAAQGAKLALTALHKEELEVVAEKLCKTYQIDCLVHEGDVTDDESVHDFYDQVHKSFGQLDILVANAGILIDGLVGMIKPEDIQTLLSVNIAGTLNHIQMAARLMKRRKKGSIILTSSIVGRCGNKGQMAYAASKAALIGAMLSASKELGRDGIRVNALAPGLIDTDMTKHLKKPMRDQLIQNTAMGRIGTPEEVADVALFLASDMSRFVTGQIIGIDGGLAV